MQRHFQVTPPSAHQVVLALEQAGLIRKHPGQPRSIQVFVEPGLVVRVSALSGAPIRPRIFRSSLIPVFFAPVGRGLQIGVGPRNIKSCLNLDFMIAVGDYAD